MKPGFFLPALAITALLCFAGCAGREIHDPALKKAILAKINPPMLWSENLRGVDASLSPSSALLGQDHHIRLHAVLRMAEDKTRFVLLLPQGAKLGQCERHRDQLTCTALSPLMKSLVTASFLALDEILRLRPAPGDSYSLHEGDKYAGISEDKLVLKRSRRIGGTTCAAIYSQEGEPLAAYCRKERGTQWRAAFFDANTPTDFKYTFKDIKEGWSLTVELIKIITTKD